MTPEELNSFLSHKHNAVVGVNRPGKGPQLTPVWYTWDGEVFRFSTTRVRAKYPNIKRDPYISLIVDSVEDHIYIVATGKAEIVEENVPELTRPLLEKYIPAENLENSMQSMGQDPDRVIVELRPESLLANGKSIDIHADKVA